MKIQCACGSVIHDGGDGLSNKAHLISDQSLFPLFDAIDRVLMLECSSAVAREAACTKLRSLVTKSSRLAWECSNCGRLYLNQGQGNPREYLPGSETKAGAFER
ncbi:MAG: hypothetical protein ABL973_06075 [Micropepsaceae bacterium]